MKFAPASRIQAYQKINTLHKQLLATSLLTLLLLAVSVFQSWLWLTLVVTIIQCMVLPLYSVLFLKQVTQKLKAHAGLDKHLSVQEMYTLNAFDFEEHIAFLFRKAGFDMVRVIGGRGPDGGIDLIVEHHGTKIAVQCKRYHPKKNPILIEPVRALIGSCSQYKCDFGIFITTSWFTKPALHRTDDSLVAKIDGQTLEQWSKAVCTNSIYTRGQAKALSPSYFE